MMTIRRYARFAPTVLLALIVGVPPTWAGTAADRCESAKNNEAGKYAECRQKAAGRYALTGDATVRDSALAKCLTKYAAKWATVEEQAANAGDPCPTVGDQARVQDAIDALSLNTATTLSGQRFVDNGDGTITDTTTRLIWEQKTGAVGTTRIPCSDVNACPDVHEVDNVYTWSSAGAPASGTIYSNFLGRLNGAYDGVCFAGQCDWRLPTRAELQTLIPFGGACFRFLCVVDPLFSATAYRYWTAQTNTTDVLYGQHVDFVSDFGNFIQDPKTFANYARAVRVAP